MNNNPTVYSLFKTLFCALQYIEKETAEEKTPNKMHFQTKSETNKI